MAADAILLFDSVDQRGDRFVCAIENVVSYRSCSILDIEIEIVVIE